MFQYIQPWLYWLNAILSQLRRLTLKVINKRWNRLHFFRRVKECKRWFPPSDTTHALSPFNISRSDGHTDFGQHSQIALVLCPHDCGHCLRTHIYENYYKRASSSTRSQLVTIPRIGGHQRSAQPRQRTNFEHVFRKCHEEGTTQAPKDLRSPPKKGCELSTTLVTTHRHVREQIIIVL